MRPSKSFLLFALLVSTCSCHGCFRGVSDELLPNGGNPELISYLQGTWAFTDNEKSVIQIKRDTIMEFNNDSLKSRRNLSYSFGGIAESYFTKDSAFDFSSERGPGLSTEDFKLVENGESPSDTMSHLLAYVSRSRLVFNTRGKISEFKRMK
jgi:hypothetical protein